MPRLGISKSNLVSRGAAKFHDLLYLALRDRKLHKRLITHTRIGGIDQGELAALEDLTWNAVGMCVVKLPTERLVVVSADGIVRSYGGGKEFDEQIQGPSDLRACATIDGYAFVCGMGREVFVRRGEGMWTSMHAPSSAADIVGFEAIAGFSKDELYAVGWEGEIWRFAKGKWTDCGSPVNVVLSGVCCAPDGTVFACGQKGALVRGKKDGWEVLTTQGLEEDFWDLRWFEGKLYVASMGYLYLLDGDQLVPVEFGMDPPSSFYRLTDADGVLWSMGQEAILSFDGKSWQRWD
jgi:hypothetical protein